MNKLSWLIYLAGMSESAGKLTVFLAVVFFLLMAVSTISYFIMHSIAVCNNVTDAEAAKKFLPTLKTGMLVAWFGFFIMSTLSVALPSKDTVYLMAASQAGETIVTNPVTQDLFQNLTKLLKQKVQEQLK